MNEDERYRLSTQYRYWSYTPSSLASQRETTNRIATERVKAAILRARVARAASSGLSGDTSEVEALGGRVNDVKMSENGASGSESGSRSGSAGPGGEARFIEGEADVNCLTAEEELKLVAFYSRQTIQLGDHLKLPTEVKATAIQYVKRFYITNSLMTYHPTSILKTALFFATKTENHYYRLSKFADAIGKTKAEDVLASEFLLTQGLRFQFDVRHPYRALEGTVMELQAIAEGQVPPLPGGSILTEREMLPNMSKRVREAHGKAREGLKTSALLTDVYFHYTPSQINLAALLLADAELILWYISQKIPSGSQCDKVQLTLQECANMLSTVPPTSQPSEADMKTLKQLAKKLQKCRNPEKIDLVAISKAAKRSDDGGEDDEKIVKKRKMEKERIKAEGEELFGPNINDVKRGA